MELCRGTRIWFTLSVIALVLSGCGGGGGSDSTDAAVTHKIAGMVNGVAVGGLKLTNGKEEITLDAAGTFSFATGVAEGESYDVQVSQHPTTPPQRCTVVNGSGNMATADISNVTVVCAQVAAAILEITNTAPGQTPILTFQITMNGAPLDISSAPLTSLTAVFAGPTSDYAGYWQVRIQGSGANGALAAVNAGDGIFQYTFPASGAIPANASGSYTVALEGYVVDNAYPGVRFSMVSPMQTFAVTDAAPVQRRAVVDDAKCNACHADLTVHANNKRGVQYCTLCHSPNLTNRGSVARLESANIVAPSLDLKVMVHKIHRGTALTRPYTLWRIPSPSAANPFGTAMAYDSVTYSGDLRACEACHLPNTVDLPLASGVSPATEDNMSCSEEPNADADSLCDDFTLDSTTATPPMTAVCTSCHDSAYTAAHAATMTTAGAVEACPTCHAIGSANGIDVYHTITK